MNSEIQQRMISLSRNIINQSHSSENKITEYSRTKEYGYEKVSILKHLENSFQLGYGCGSVKANTGKKIMC